LHEPLTIATMARRAAMSPRNFIRRFQEATGSTPLDWLIDARLAHARELLESTDLAVEDVAQRCGFGAAATLRHHFRRKMALSPVEYRERFSQRSA
jgi:AraC family transcriptional activator FtrA